jgi:pimeloyl-ACP methyl ester carboxylesterase
MRGLSSSPPVCSRPPLEPLAEGGAGPPIVFIHGLIESSAMWRAPPVRAALEGRRAFAAPLPGHHPWRLGEGDAGLFQADRLIEAYAGALRAAFGDEPARLVGHSTGALIALELARLEPERVADVMVFCAPGAGDLDGRRSLSARLALAPGLGPHAFRAMLRWWLRDEARFRRGVATALGDREAALTVETGMLDDLRRSEPAQLLACARWVAARDAFARLPEVRQPVCVVLSTRDPVVPPDHQLRVARALPRGFTLMLDAGHIPTFERPFDAALALMAWLGREARAEKAKAPPPRPPAPAPLAKAGALV